MFPLRDHCSARVGAWDGESLQGKWCASLAAYPEPGPIGWGRDAEHRERGVSPGARAGVQSGEVSAPAWLARRGPAGPLKERRHRLGRGRALLKRFSEGWHGRRHRDFIGWIAALCGGDAGRRPDENRPKGPIGRTALGDDEAWTSSPRERWGSD